MWKPGIKIGPQDWREKLEKTRAQYCEVWYRVDWEERYEEMFRYLEDHSIHTGLHFWGVLDGNVAPNLAYPDVNIWKPTLELVQNNIIIASQHKFDYVNIHVGNAALEHLDLDRHFLKIIENSTVDPNSARQTLFEHAPKLHTFAKDHGVRLIIETVPSREPEHWQTLEGRLYPHQNYALSNSVVEELGKQFGIAVCNDFTHTAAEGCTTAANATIDREFLWQYLLARTQALAPYTKLIHCNTMSEPFNGTDSHDGITDEDFSHHVFPSKDQCKTLLSLFSNRDDVWVVNEPRDHHEENFFALQKMRDAI